MQETSASSLVLVAVMTVVRVVKVEKLTLNRGGGLWHHLSPTYNAVTSSPPKRPSSNSHSNEVCQVTLTTLTAVYNEQKRTNGCEDVCSRFNPSCRKDWVWFQNLQHQNPLSDTDTSGVLHLKSGVKEAIGLSACLTMVLLMLLVFPEIICPHFMHLWAVEDPFKGFSWYLLDLWSLVPSLLLWLQNPTKHL